MTRSTKRPVLVSEAGAATDIFRPQGLRDLLLYRISQVLAVAGAPITRLCEGRFGITRREWRLIALLAEADGLSSSELADLAQLDRARTSRSLTVLENKRLIERHPIPADGRRVRLELTDTGRQLFSLLWPLAAEHHRHLLSSISETQAEALDQALIQIHAHARSLLASYPDLPHANRRGGGTRTVRRPASITR